MLHIHAHAAKETARVKWKAIHSQSCKLPSPPDLMTRTQYRVFTLYIQEQV